MFFISCNLTLFLVFSCKLAYPVCVAMLCTVDLYLIYLCLSVWCIGYTTESKGSQALASCFGSRCTAKSVSVPFQANNIEVLL